MSIELVIDTREHSLINLLKDMYDIKVEQLDLGDIIFRKDGKIILIIERKSILDLKASICDKRHREQKARLLHCGIPIERIMYIIEGNLNKSLQSKISGMPVSTLVSSIINTQLRDGIKVHKTASLVETSEFIKKLFEKLNKESDKFFKTEQKTQMTDEKYASVLHKKKKNNMTPNVWFISQLSLIPHVTEKIASKVLKKYPTVVDLISSYEELSSEQQINMLADIKYDLSTGKQRKIGTKISERIYKFFYGIM